MNIVDWFSRVKKRFQKQASDVTHRAVTHSEPVTPPASDNELDTHSSGGLFADSDVKFARIFWVT
jgi:hypothetical protein